MKERSFVCVECGVLSLARHPSRIRCEDCAKKVKHTSQISKNRKCVSCKLDFVGKTCQIKCDSCRLNKKLYTCMVCQKEYNGHNNSKIVCRECLNYLLSVGKVWCIECNSIGELGGKFYSLRCKKHTRIRIRKYIEDAKKRGVVVNKKTKVFKTQSLKERNKIADAFELGMSYNQITKKLKVTEGRIKSAIASGFASPPINRNKKGRGGWFTTTDIEEIMGFSKDRMKNLKSIIGMLEYGVVRETRGPCVYIIRIEDFTNWLKNRDYWMLWEISDIKDPKWKRFCKEFRDDSEYWLNLKEAEHCCNFSRDTIGRWAKEKKIPAKYIRGSWYIWSLDLREYMLKTFGIEIKT
jgi:hypothetical protein